MTLRFLPAIGVVLAASLTVAACGAAGGGHPTAHSTGQASSMAAAASASTTPADTGATVPAGSPSTMADETPGKRVSPAPPERAFASARAAWKSAAAAPAVTINTYLLQAADDLRSSGNSGYRTAINDLTYLANLPATNDTPAQQAQARSDVQALDGFF